jgi:hypothetical protein
MQDSSPDRALNGAMRPFQRAKLNRSTMLPVWPCFYGLMHIAAARRGRLRAGFLHVPSLATRGLTVEDAARGIGIVLQVAAKDPRRSDK